MATPPTTMASPSQPGAVRRWLNSNKASSVPTTGSIVAATAAGAASMRRTAAKKKRLAARTRSEEHTSELQSLAYLVCRLLLEKKKKRHLNSRHRRSGTERCDR